MMYKHILALATIVVALCSTLVTAEEPGTTKRKLTIVTLGDSITKGVRSGVKPEETFASIIERELGESDIDAKVTNVGIGGERTDQASRRLDKVASIQPVFVIVMYGTNDSYVDRGKSDSRLSLETYRANLQKIVAELLVRGIEPILMTEPRWAVGAKNGLGEDPNIRLAPYMEACREVASECHVPLIDHFEHWTRAEKHGQKLLDWTTDRCHPNPRGHRELAATMMPVLLKSVMPRMARIKLQVKLETVMKHDDNKFLWFHPRATAIPASNASKHPSVLMTLQKHLRTSDHYSGQSVMNTTDLGKTWSEPDARPELDWVRDGDIDIAVADVTPGWHPPTSKVIAVGAQVRYSAKGKQLEDQQRSHQTAYAVFDPKTGKWLKWRHIEMPKDDKFNFARSACAQFVVESDGTVLLPFYIAESAKVPFSTTVVRCTFDGENLTYQEHGNVLQLKVARGLYEPSLIKFQGRYYLTIRNDVKGYVTVGDDGLQYRPIKPWLFDDGGELGSYNTQQHWLSVGDSRDDSHSPASPKTGLFLVYTRRGADNDHIIRHRAPLFMAQVNPQRLHVIRSTELIVVPERGAALGNFGVASITANESWVTVAEGVWNDDARRRGAEGAVFVAHVKKSD